MSIPSQETGTIHLVRSALYDTERLVKYLEAGTRKTTELRVRFLADRITRAFWLAYMGTFSPEVEESFALAQEAQLVLTRLLKHEPMEDWEQDTRHICISHYSRLLMKTSPIAEKQIEGCY